MTPRLEARWAVCSTTVEDEDTETDEAPGINSAESCEIIEAMTLRTLNREYVDMLRLLVDPLKGPLHQQQQASVECAGDAGDDIMMTDDCPLIPAQGTGLSATGELMLRTPEIMPSVMSMLLQ